MPEDAIKDRVAAIRQLLDAFRMERVVYMVVTLICLAIVITIAVVLAVHGKAQLIEIGGLVLSSGGILASAGRILQMWSDAIHLLARFPQEQES